MYLISGTRPLFLRIDLFLDWSDIDAMHSPGLRSSIKPDQSSGPLQNREDNVAEEKIWWIHEGWVLSDRYSTNAPKSQRYYNAQTTRQQPTIQPAWLVLRSLSPPLPSAWILMQICPHGPPASTNIFATACSTADMSIPCGFPIGSEGTIEASVTNRLFVPNTLTLLSTTALDALVPILAEPTQWLESMVDLS